MSTLQTTADFLEHNGYTVIRCGSLAKAMESFALDHAHIDRIVTDLNMNPRGLPPALIDKTDNTRLTGWMFLLHSVYDEPKNDRIKTVVYSDFVGLLKEHMESIEETRDKEHDHERKVFAAVKLLTKSSVIDKDRKLMELLK